MNYNYPLILIDLDEDIVRSKNRDELVFSAKELVETYAERYGVKIHYSGMPYMRSVNSVILQSEISLFIFLTLFITSFILYLFSDHLRQC